MDGLKSDPNGSSYFSLSFSSLKERGDKVQVIAIRFLKKVQECYLNPKNLKLSIGTVCAGMLIIPLYPTFGLILLISSASLLILLGALKARAFIAHKLMTREALLNQRLEKIEKMKKGLSESSKKINEAKTIKEFQTEFNSAKGQLEQTVKDLEGMKNELGLASNSAVLLNFELKIHSCHVWKDQFSKECERLSKEYANNKNMIEKNLLIKLLEYADKKLENFKELLKTSI